MQERRMQVVGTLSLLVFAVVVTGCQTGSALADGSVVPGQDSATVPVDTGGSTPQLDAYAAGGAGGVSSAGGAGGSAGGSITMATATGGVPFTGGTARTGGSAGTAGAGGTRSTGGTATGGATTVGGTTGAGGISAGGAGPANSGANGSRRPSR
jgi:hypothetical protein